MVSVLSTKAAVAAGKPAGQPISIRTVSISTVSGDSSNSSTCETPTPEEAPPVPSRPAATNAKASLVPTQQHQHQHS
eukprot:scaffold177864_cov17-Tisochrysis_lutea.AAC.2